ncbi:hypothetical protein MMC21_005810 [Puttea exsequens]|nr:hypothetical protein [Puttea exsequens]
MEGPQPIWLSLAGSFHGRSAEFAYDPEKDGGSLVVKGADEYEETISNRNIVAVLDTPKNGPNNHRGAQRILYMTRLEQPTTGWLGTEYRLDIIPATNLPALFVEANLIAPRIVNLSVSKSASTSPFLYVIISTGSGYFEAQSYYDDVVKPAFTAVGIDDDSYYVHTTSSNKSITEFTSAMLLPRANEGIAQTVLLLSGDGGVVDIVNTILSSSRSEQYTKPVLGLVAMGTGNALANSTGLNKDLTRGLRHFFRGEPHSVPTFAAMFSPGSQLLVDEGRMAEPISGSGSEAGTLYGTVVCSWALHASLVADSDTTEYRKHGAQRFQMAAKELLAPSDGSSPHVYQGKVTLFKKTPQGEVTEHPMESIKFMYLLATMMSNLEEKLNISPRSKPLDGQLRLLHFGPTSSAEVMRIMGLAFQGGSHVEEQNVGYEDIEGLRIDFGEEKDGRWRRICVDGKIIRVSEGGWVEVKRADRTADILDIIADLG